MVLTQGGQVAGGGITPNRPTVDISKQFSIYTPATEGQIILNSEGKGNPGTAPGGLRKTSRVYYRKVDLTDGAELKSSFGDVNVGNSATSTIQGGPFKSIFYSSYTLPSKPKYGDAKLVGLHFGVPVTNVTRKTLSSVPNFNVWKGKQTSFTDGSCTVDDTPVAAFMSHIDVAPNVYEGFDGGAAGATGVTRRIGNRVVSHMDEYLPADWAWRNIQAGTKQG